MMKETDDRLVITSVRALNPRALRLEFNNGEVRLFDRHRLRGGKYIPLMNEEYFTKPAIKEGNLGWEDLDVTCNAQYVYDRSVPYDESAKAKEYIPTKKDIREERVAMVLFPAMAVAGIVGIIVWYMSL